MSENIAQNVCRKMLPRMHVGKCYPECISENIAQNVCRKMLPRMHVGKCYPECMSENVTQNVCEIFYPVCLSVPMTIFQILFVAILTENVTCFSRFFSLDLRPSPVSDIRLNGRLTIIVEAFPKYLVYLVFHIRAPLLIFVLFKLSYGGVVVLYITLFIVLSVGTVYCHS